MRANFLGSGAFLASAAREEPEDKAEPVGGPAVAAGAEDDKPDVGMSAFDCGAPRPFEDFGDFAGSVMSQSAGAHAPRIAACSSES
mmetsp:Transcript_121208/g.258726  ORF Transcript_121208/g.258726 Transcript_121208/m.258726 type:complete len:86 (-) Transcript_121208:102-359(-)